MLVKETVFFSTLNMNDAFMGQVDGEKHSNLLGVSICTMIKSKIRLQGTNEYDNISINCWKLACVCGWDFRLFDTRPIALWQRGSAIGQPQSAVSCWFPLELMLQQHIHLRAYALLNGGSGNTSHCSLAETVGFNSYCSDSGHI